MNNKHGSTPLLTPPVGLELYTLRHEFQESARDALEKTAAMGYDGVEFSIDHQHLYQAPYLKGLLDDLGLKCFGYLVTWEDMQPDRIMQTLAYNAALGNHSVAVGSAPVDLLRTEDGVKQVIENLLQIHEVCTANGFTAGYHNHDVEFSIRYHGKFVWDMIFDAMPSSFPLVFDTGNAMDGGGQPMDIVNRYPGRMPIVHTKPYSLKDEYATMIGDDDIPWADFLRRCLESGGTKYLIVEYGNSIKYPPYVSSAMCLERLRNILRGLSA